MIGTLSLGNRQRVRSIDTRLLRRITLHLLEQHFRPPAYELCLHLLAAPAMAKLNETFLRHQGSTDVITFDYAPGVGTKPRRRSLRPILRQTGAMTPDADGKPNLQGEIFICLDDAAKQAREFRTTWQSELVRYVIHGLLHLHGYNDRHAAARRLMKREENRLLRETARRFPLSRLHRHSKVRP